MGRRWTRCRTIVAYPLFVVHLLCAAWKEWGEQDKKERYGG